MEQLAPHTLLKLKSKTSLVDSAALSIWASAMLAKAPYVIVRRGKQDKQVPVGIRGFLKNQRFASFIKFNEWSETITPAQALTFLPNVSPARMQLAAFKKLKEIFPLLQKYEWGVSGSLQFEMVTGLQVVTSQSDIDIIMSCTKNITKDNANKLLKRLAEIRPGTHVDVQVVHGQNGFSLEEFVQHRSDKILVKTQNGPVLAEDPWNFLK
ncbi:malonate decarboxylase holo-ACP synthase [Lactobacillus sp. ESL0791]|uniref:malonate decarboxylase holo-ACP synthase n=1 Tax=Lactobacillus sp. ESL0791 TaxID=2983234 RepID=UPI0023FA02DE|nr:malonate decarboxylase holo-ACP synthase [Lactobacillus sp. ESL0791]MDF7639051.1 malonate decarboxylase holo-ACP synthase [Lactobacillus sp. ESL0791]